MLTLFPYPDWWRGGFALSHVRKNVGEEVVEPLMQEPERC